MSDTVGDYLLERLAHLGDQAHLRLPGRRDQRDHRRASAARATDSGRSSSRSATRRWRRSWPARTPSSPARSGVCMATSGPGAIHLLNGLYDAKLDHQPVVAIVGQQARAGDRRQLPAGSRPDSAVQGRRARVRRDRDGADADPPSHRPRDPDRAATERTVTAIIIPNDVQEADAVPEPPHEHGTVHSGLGYRRAADPPHDDGPRPGRGDPQRRRARRDAGRRRARCAPPTRWRRWPSCSAPASPRRCSARPCCPTTCRT